MRLYLKKYKSYFEEFTSYGVSQFLVMLLPIIILPILTSSISQDDYADYSIYKSLIVVATPLIGMGCSTYLLKYYYIDLKDSFMSFFTVVISFSFIVSIFLLIALYFLDNIVLSILKLDNFLIILFVIINTFLLSFYTLILTFCRAKSDKISFLKLNIIVFIFTITPIIIFYYYQLLSLKAILVIHSFSLFIAVNYGIFKFFNYKTITFDKKLLFKVLRFSLPLILYSILAQIYLQSDKFIINSYLTKSDLAVYYAGFQVCFGLAAFGTVIDLIWSPYVFKSMANETKIPSHLFKSFFFIAIFTLFVSIIYFFLMPFFQWILLPEKYYMQWQLYLWFIVGLFCKILYTLINPLISVFNKNSYFVYITLITGVFSISLNLYLIKYGLIFAAIVFCISWFIQLTLLIISVSYANKNLSILQSSS